MASDLMRYGLVTKGSQGPDPLTVAAYLYANYRVLRKVSYEPWPGHTEPAVVIAGRDDHGFTLDALMARLASGLMRCDEIDLSHPVMSQIPMEA